MAEGGKLQTLTQFGLAVSRKSIIWMRSIKNFRMSVFSLIFGGGSDIHNAFQFIFSAFVRLWLGDDMLPTYIHTHTTTHSVGCEFVYVDCAFVLVMPVP